MREESMDSTYAGCLEVDSDANEERIAIGVTASHPIFEAASGAGYC